MGLCVFLHLGVVIPEKNPLIIASDPLLGFEEATSTKEKGHVDLIDMLFMLCFAIKKVHGDIEGLQPSVLKMVTWLSQPVRYYTANIDDSYDHNSEDAAAGFVSDKRLRTELHLRRGHLSKLRVLRKRS